MMKFWVRWLAPRENSDAAMSAAEKKRASMLSSHSLVESVREAEASYLRFDMARRSGLRQIASQIDFATRAALQAGLKLCGH
jgi:hypothetical protein